MPETVVKGTVTFYDGASFTVRLTVDIISQSSIKIGRIKSVDPNDERLGKLENGMIYFVDGEISFPPGLHITFEPDKPQPEL